MQRSFAKPSSTSAPSDAVGVPRVRLLTERISSAVALLAVAVWMGGLLALGALAAPVVFAVVPLPTSADAMTIVFRRFDAVAMVCAALVLVMEAARAANGARPRFDRARSVFSLLAAILAVFQGIFVSPRIAHLHALGVRPGPVSSSGSAAMGASLSRLHEVAVACAQTQVVLLAVVVALHVVTLSSARGHLVDKPGSPV
ncbi:MAG TPA: DUF4149 domain-containing protein [Polyangiaceae bacterium]|nr:DUF4149 domain-containing protein [Polyangiaceae bacterium]